MSYTTKAAVLLGIALSFAGRAGAETVLVRDGASDYEIVQGSKPGPGYGRPPVNCKSSSGSPRGYGAEHPEYFALVDGKRQTNHYLSHHGGQVYSYYQNPPNREKRRQVFCQSLPRLGSNHRRRPK